MSSLDVLRRSPAHSLGAGTQNVPLALPEVAADPSTAVVTCVKVGVKEIQWGLYATIGLHIATGASDTLGLTWQSVTMARGERLSHPFIQSFLVLFGQALNLALSFVHVFREWNHSSSPPTKTEASVLLKLHGMLILTGVSEAIETALTTTALYLMDPSVFSMIRMTQLLFAFVIQRYIVPAIRVCRRSRVVTAEHDAQPLVSVSETAKFSWWQYLGLVLVLLGVSLVFLSTQNVVPWNCSQGRPVVQHG